MNWNKYRDIDHFCSEMKMSYKEAVEYLHNEWEKIKEKKE